MAIRDKDIYKGREKSHRVAKAIAAVAIFLVVAAIALFFGLRHYAVYDENGNATIVLPFLQKDEVSDETPASAEP